MIKVIVIDDEPLALKQIQKMLELTPFFELTAACESAFEAMRVMEDNEVDAIFTDINMPDLSGLDFVNSLPSPPIIVLTTAYSEFAIEGYRANAIDYLLKPFSQADFLRAATKVKKQYELLHPSLTTSDLAENRIEEDILFVKDGYNIVRISVGNIIYVKSQNEYLKIYMTDGSSHMALMSMKRLADMLPQSIFIRIHRSYIVNMNHITTISRQRVHLIDDTLLPIGDLYKDTVLQYINDRMIGK